jgi:D-glycero-alpha-D-manno-heptose-7-phosphate kinase
MIISRAPVRISLGGGGTDLPSYYSKFGGFLIAAAIDKYIFISINKRFFSTIRLSYSETEIVDSVDQVKHRIFREALKLLGIVNQVEIVSIADVPSNCGLGSSSAFTVSLLNGLHAYKREFVSLQDLAEEACRLEIDILGEPIGKQDQYMSALGGLCSLTFETDGRVRVEPLHLPADKMMDLENNLSLFYTGVERKASEILSFQNERTKTNDKTVVSTLDRIKEIGLDSRRALERGDLDEFGALLDLHWQIKKGLSEKISSPRFDEVYETARRSGALGGKIMGAGGGGFFMFYSQNRKGRLIEALQRLGLSYTPFRFDFEGAKILVNMRRG